MTTSSILDGKIPYKKQACLEVAFSGTEDNDQTFVDIVFDSKVLLTQSLCKKSTEFKYMFSDDPGEHHFQIVLRGEPNGAMLYIQDIRIEGLNMRLTMEDSGTCVMNNKPHVPSEYMGQVGYQSLKFSTPIYPWLLANERKPTYYL